MERPYGDRARSGQAMLLMALALVVLCGMAALAVDVGVAWSKQHRLQSAAASAALDARQLLANRANENLSTLTNLMVWNSLVASLANSNLTIGNPTGLNAPADPCAMGYTTNQVAITALYLNDQNQPITDTTTGSLIVIGASSPTNVPDGASGVQVALTGCQQAAFGGVIGHRYYTIKVNPSAGQPLIVNTATPAPTQTSYPTDTATGTSTATSTNTPTTIPSSTSTPTGTITSTSTNTSTSTKTSTSTSTPTNTNTPTPIPCIVPVVTVADHRNQGFYTAFTLSAKSDINASWTVSTGNSSGGEYLALYSGTPLSSGVPPPSQGTSTATPIPTISGELDHSTLAAHTPGTISIHHLGAPPGNYTVYFYNFNNSAESTTGVSVSVCPDTIPALTSTPTNTVIPPTSTGTLSPSNTPTASLTATLTAPPTSTSTGTPSPSATSTPAVEPYSASAAPDGLWCGHPPFPIQPENEPGNAPGDAKYQPEEYYCPGAYTMGSKILLYANGKGVGNNYGHDADFKGYIGDSSLYAGLLANANSTAGFQALFLDEVDIPEPAGHGNNAPSSCAPTVLVPLITRIAHHGASDWFAAMALIQVTITACGDPTEGTISGVIYEPLVTVMHLPPIVQVPPGTTYPYYGP